MMRNVNRYLILGLMLSLLVGCEVDGGLPEGVVADTYSSIAYLKSMYAGEPYEVKEDIFIRGVVVANDRSGNLAKRLFVEDSSGGIEIKLDKQKLYEQFLPGDSVVVFCGGLTLGSYGGMLQLGSQAKNGYETDYIAETRLSTHIKLTGGRAAHRPVHSVAMDEVSSSLLGCFVMFRDVQFADSELNNSWAEEDMAANRLLIDKEGDTFVVRTNDTADFATEPLPYGSGSVGGVITIFNGVYQLMVADINDVSMSEPRF